MRVKSKIWKVFILSSTVFATFWGAVTLGFATLFFFLCVMTRNIHAFVYFFFFDDMSYCFNALLLKNLLLKMNHMMPFFVIIRFSL